MMQSGGFLGNLLSKLSGALMKLAIPLPKKCISTIRINCCYVCN